MPFSDLELAQRLGMSSQQLQARRDPNNSDNYSASLVDQITKMQLSGPEDERAQEEARSAGRSTYTPPQGVGILDTILSGGRGDVPIPERSAPPAMGMMTAPPAAIPGMGMGAGMGDLHAVERAEGMPNTGVKPTGMGTPAPASEPIRALRMPGGKIIFTNQVSSSAVPQGSTEISTKEAGREIRAKDQAAAGMAQIDRMPGSDFDFQQVSPTQSAASDLIRRSASQEARRIAGEDVPEAGLSVMGATPETQDRLMLESAGRELELATVANQLREANRTPADQAADRNANLQIFNQIYPMIEAAQKRIAGIGDPNSPLYIADPTTRERALQYEQSQITALLQSSGLSRPTSYIE